MAEQFAVVPAHAVANRVEGIDAALEHARSLVEKDKQPRIVVRLVSEARVSPTPKIDVVDFEGHAHG